MCIIITDIAIMNEVVMYIYMITSQRVGVTVFPCWFSDSGASPSLPQC